jgi:hypothetical protein
MNSNMSFRTSQRTCELRNEIRNICGQSFVKSTVKTSPGWGILHSQLALGPCISLQVVSRHPGIYTVITNLIKFPGVFPGGGMVTPGIDSCIMHFACPRLINNVIVINCTIYLIAKLHHTFCSLIFNFFFNDISGVIYYTLGNIHPKHRSQLDAIQLLSIATCPVIKKHGIDAILEPFLDDLKCLERVQCVHHY